MPTNKIRKIFLLAGIAILALTTSACGRYYSDSISAPRSILPRPIQDATHEITPRPYTPNRSSRPASEPRRNESRRSPRHPDNFPPPVRNTPPATHTPPPRDTGANNNQNNFRANAERATNPTQAYIPDTSPTRQHNSAQRELASHQTEFNAKETNRASNIELAAKTINGHIVQPGETFSFNETVGPTNQKRGYKKGTIFIQGEKHEGFGGGVCQVSTTIFNAAEDAGMTILERHDHSLPVTYAKSGEEAATSYGGIDFKFQNDKPHPVVINCAVKDGKITATISGI